MFGTFTKRLTNGTRLRGIGWMYIENLYPMRLSFIFNKATKFIKGPAVQATAHTLIALDPFSDVFQILQYNFRTFVSLSFKNKVFSNTVIDMSDVASFSARDLS